MTIVFILCGGRVALAVALVAAATAPAQEVTLVEDGDPRAVLVLSPMAFAAEIIESRRGGRAVSTPSVADERRAAEEIQEQLQVISGATLPIVVADARPEDLLPIFLLTGTSKIPKLAIW